MAKVYKLSDGLTCPCPIVSGVTLQQLTTYPENIATYDLKAIFRAAVQWVEDE